MPNENFEPYFGTTPESERKGNMLYRTLGGTGEQVSLIGLGGHHIGRIQEDDQAVRLIRSAIDQGVTFMDNSWDYHDGLSELRMGKALLDGYRDRIFLMTKVDGRDKKTAAKQIEESIRRLQTDRIDLLQFHEVIRLEGPDLIFSESGAAEAVLEARQAGKVRFVGFTGHKDPLVHLRMLEIADGHGFEFDTVQMPLNVMDGHFRSFQHRVLPELNRRNIGVLGMKSMGDGFILKSDTVSPVECLHYAMNLPVSTVITGMESLERLDQGLEAVRTFTPFSREQVDSLLDRTRDAALSGKFEPFKTTSKFDATARRPEWLGVMEQVHP
ncbi:MAG: aldo/keto reductase [Desulfovibrionales bacterium]